MERKPVQLTISLHKKLRKDLIKYDKKTFAELVSYYRKLALQFIKQTK